MDPTGRICTAQLCGPKILASYRSRQVGNNLLEEFIKFWVLRMVFFHAFVSGFCTKVRRTGGVMNLEEDWAIVRMSTTVLALR